MNINPELQQYIENESLPRYDHHDAAHRRDHAHTVIEQSLMIVGNLQQEGHHVDADMAYTIAAYHDTGLSEGRDIHHLASGRIIRNDQRLRQWFTPQQIEVMAQAAEDHRASAKQEPRSIYGRIVAEADRVIVPEVIVQRTIQFGLDHYPELTTEEHYRRMVQHLKEKYGPGGYLQLYFPHSPNAERLADLRQLIGNEKELRLLFNIIYTRLTSGNA